MNGIDSIDTQIVREDNLTLTPGTIVLMKQGAKWAAFLGIMGFIISGIIFLGGIVMIMSAMSYYYGMEYFVGAGVAYFLISALNFLPSLFLYKYARKAKNALSDYDSMSLEEATRNLKMTFKFMGISVIVVISIYIVVFLAAIIINVL